MELKNFLKKISELAETSSEIPDPTMQLNEDELAAATADHEILADIIDYLQMQNLSVEKPAEDVPERAPLSRILYAAADSDLYPSSQTVHLREELAIIEKENEYLDKMTSIKQKQLESTQAALFKNSREQHHSDVDASNIKKECTKMVLNIKQHTGKINNSTNEFM